MFLISGADRTLSVRMLREKGSLAAWEPISILPQRLLTVQLTLTYAGAMLQKLWLPDRQSGDILYYSLFHVGSTPLAYSIARLDLPMVFYDVLVWLAKIFEFTMFIELCIPKVQRFFFAAGAAFHISIAFLFSIWSFLGFIPLYILFVSPERVKDWMVGDGGPFAPLRTSLNLVARRRMVGDGGLEPPTSTLSVSRSNQLS